MQLYENQIVFLEVTNNVSHFKQHTKEAWVPAHSVIYD